MVKIFWKCRKSVIVVKFDCFWRISKKYYRHIENWACLNAVGKQQAGIEIILSGVAIKYYIKLNIDRPAKNDVKKLERRSACLNAVGKRQAGKKENLFESWRSRDELFSFSFKRTVLVIFRQSWPFWFFLCQDKKNIMSPLRGSNFGVLVFYKYITPLGLNHFSSSQVFPPDFSVQVVNPEHRIKTII